MTAQRKKGHSLCLVSYLWGYITKSTIGELSGRREVKMASSPRLAILEGGCRALWLSLLVAVLPACVGVVEQAPGGQALDPPSTNTTGGASGLPHPSGTGGSPFIVSTGGSRTGGSGTGGANTGGSSTGGASTGGAFVDMTSTGGAMTGGSGAGGRAGQPDGGVGSDGAAAPYDGGVVTWTEVYSTLLNSTAYASNCAGAGCHNPGAAHNIGLATSAAGYTAIRAIVTPGSTTAGSLIKVLTSGSMPRGRPKMAAADLAKIQAWIAAGALNN